MPSANNYGHSSGNSARHNGHVALPRPGDTALAPASRASKSGEQYQAGSGSRLAPKVRRTTGNLLPLRPSRRDRTNHGPWSFLRPLKHAPLRSMVAKCTFSLKRQNLSHQGRRPPPGQRNSILAVIKRNMTPRSAGGIDPTVTNIREVGFLGTLVIPNYSGVIYCGIGRRSRLVRRWARRTGTPETISVHISYAQPPTTVNCGAVWGHGGICLTTRSVVEHDHRAHHLHTQLVRAMPHGQQSQGVAVGAGKAVLRLLRWMVPSLLISRCGILHLVSFFQTNVSPGYGIDVVPGLTLGREDFGNFNLDQGRANGLGFDHGADQ